MLCLPGDLAYVARDSGDLGKLLLAEPWRMPIAPRALDENAPCPAVASLGDASALDLLAGRLLARHQAEIAHQVARGRKPRQVAHLGQECTRRDEVETAHRHQCRDPLCQRPVR